MLREGVTSDKPKARVPQIPPPLTSISEHHIFRQLAKIVCLWTGLFLPPSTHPCPEKAPDEAYISRNQGRRGVTGRTWARRILRFSGPFQLRCVSRCTQRLAQHAPCASMRQQHSTQPLDSTLQRVCRSTQTGFGRHCTRLVNGVRLIDMASMFCLFVLF